MKYFIYLLFIIISHYSLAQESSLKDISIHQKEIVARLTGIIPIKDGITLRQRASYQERKHVVDYLSNYLRQIGFEVDNQHYKVPNSNVFLDFFFKPVQGINVVGTLAPTNNAKDYVILGAHYDSERDTPGAIDNATGVALCLALANELAKWKSRNHYYTIVLFDQEEDDEVGSRAYVDFLQQQEIAVHSVHIFDMLGWDANNNKAISLQSPAPFLEKLYTEHADQHNIPYEIIGGGASDNISFLRAGYPTVGFFEEEEDYTPYYHSPDDTYETVNFIYLESCTNFLIELLKTINNNNHGNH
jgi:hypothetical protein